MLKFLQPPHLPNDLNWNFSADTSILTWVIRARSYNIIIANFMLFLITAVNLSCSLFLYHAFEGTSQPWRVFWPALIFSSMLLFSLTASHARVNFACRITSSGMEYCKWKKNFRINPKVLGGVTIFVSIIFISLAATTPGLSFASVAGPGGMGIMALMQLRSQRLQEPYSQYNHLTFDWAKVKQLTIATNREVVALKYGPVNEGWQKFWNSNIFCEKGQKEAVAELIRSHLSPDVPVIRGRVSCD
ncbi:hypothetical protein SJI00_22230 [Pseudomonas sp. RP23018S]|uniref:hypothetical protein n=1 Tax=Pseudomonas sp. RP23018S TaxID=3096037 RepID=UPI002ACA595E|nr:hypothetical protein [Pseudomonas sp. RP23018S]MDZ5605491.1 hypothetical protein [Pseudomonas sp. RP23018S]